MPEQRRLSGHGQPLTDDSDSIKAPGGSWGTPGANTTERAMQFREEPNDPVSPDFRPGLVVKRALGPEARVSTSDRRSPRNWLRTGIRPSWRHDVVFFVKVAAEEPVGGTRRRR